jgi:hypothetical protein
MPKLLQTNLTAEAEGDLLRLFAFAEELDTYKRRKEMLISALKALPKNWKRQAFYDKQLGIRWMHVLPWYNIFFRVDEAASRIIVFAVLAIAEDDQSRLARRQH